MGIGTTGPSSTRTLHVQGDAEINTNLVANTAVYTKDWYGIGSNDQRILTSAGTAQVTIKNDGSVGIGSTSPLQKLDVAGVIRSSSTSRIQADTYNNSANSANIIYRSSSKTIVGNNASALVILDGGNVGIGTTDPVVLLHVDGSSPKIRLRDSDAAGTPLAHIDASDGALKLQADSSDETASSFLTLEVDGSEHVRVASDGDVGIGTTNPQKHVHIRGSAPYIRLEEDSASNKRLDLYVDPSTAIAYITANQSAQQLSFQTASTDRIRITNGGNVGIGVTDPDATLEVKGAGNTNATTSFVVRDSDDAVLLKARNDGVVTVEHGYFYVSASAGAYVQNNFRVRGSLFNDQGTLQIGNSSGTAFDGDVNFDSNTLFVDSSTNRIGIGTTNPQEELDLRGDMRLDSAGNTDRSIYFRNQSSIAKVRSDAALQFDVGVSSSPTAAMYIEEDTRDVGIGITSPTSKLHIYGGNVTGLAGSLRNDSKNRMNMKVAMADVTRYIGTVTQYGNGDSAGFTIRLYDGAEKVFRIVRVVVQNSGGTNYPSITVEGGGEDTDIHIDLKYKNRDGDASKTDFFLDPTGTKYFNQYIEIEGFIFKETGYNTTSLSSCSLDTDLALNVLDHGNGSRVGIGTTDPSAKLHAEGSMIVKGDASWAGTDNQNGAIFMNTAGRGLKGAFSSSYARNLILSNSNYIDLGEQSSLVYGFRFYAGSASSPVGTYDFFTSGSNSRLHIEKGGNIAIGNTSAGAKLDIRTDSSTTNGVALRGESSTGAYFRLYHGGAIDTDGSITAARFIQDTNVGNNFYAIQLSRSSLSDSNPDIYGSDNGLVLGANSSEDVLKLDTGNTVLVRGGSDPDTNSYKADFAVGVGTNPQISWRNQQVQIGGTDMNWAGKVFHDGTFQMAGWSSHMKFYTQSSSSSAYDIYFSPWNGSSVSEAMRILGEGRVGIGTNNPSVLLDVYNTGGWGNIDIDGTSGGELRFQKAGSTYLSIYASDTSSTSSVIKATDHLHIYSNADSDGSHSIYLNDAGNCRYRNN